MRHSLGKHLGRLGVVALVIAPVSGAMSAVGGSAAGASGAPITIAMVTSLTGPGASEFSQSPAGFKARIALQNAQGGVNGHKLVGLVLDDQTSPTGVSTAIQDALSKGSFGLVSTSPLFFLAAKVPNQQGVPVTGGFFDGPEWGQQPYTNMFAADVGSVDPTYPVNTAIGSFMKTHGGTVVCSYGYSISPSSSRSAIGTVDSFQHAGGKEGVLDTAVPFGGVDFTTPALVAKQKGCNAFYAGLDDNSNVALAAALKTAGVKPKVVVFPTGYEPSLVKSPAWKSVQGGYFDTTFRPFQLPNAGTKQMQSALEKYANFKASDFPSFGQYESWLGADLMIKGLQLAGKNPTHAGVIKALRNLKSYNGNGLLPVSINFSTIFGHDSAKACGWYMIAEKNGFVPSSSQPSCGTDIPGTSTASS
ncbi:MAG TPA: ABC transporter substrate-binding protein [Acidimicrobiales bacterium]|jgi:branched-chain amino acid transport system substrate-binding protein|nr:ABC transporter substrate-binding protein [Acidimicrobiales bacterium]